MKLQQVILARVIRQVAVMGTGAPAPDAVKRIKERYQFMNAPERFEDLHPKNPLAAMQGLVFQEGVFVANEKRIGILRLQFSPGIILADTRATTDESEAILDDYIESANKIAPEAITPAGPTYFLSQIEVKIERPQGLFEKLPQYENAARIIDRHLEDDGLKLPKYGFFGINLNFDSHGLGILPPAFFNIERRVGFSFDKNVFFSQAPLRTKDHVALLEKLDATVH
jgi:hypothetical protein